MTGKQGLRRGSALVATCWLGLALGCAKADELALADPGSATGSIINGTVSSEQAVVALRITALGGSCSGTLITPTVVLTAAHCLDLGVPLATDADIFFGDDDSGPGESRAIIRAQVHPDWGSGWADYGLIEIDAAAPSGVTPIPHLPASLGLSAADVGASVRFAGYGIDENGNYGRRLETTGTIDALCLGSDFCDYLSPNSFGYPEDPSGPCHGDSGGPAFITRSGTVYVAGITSYGDGEQEDCSDSTFGVSMIVDAEAALIDSFISGADIGPSMLDGGGVGGTWVCQEPAICTPGGACGSQLDCPAGGYCYEEGFPGGYCLYECTVDADCVGDAVCWYDQGSGVCFSSCNSAADCRPSYTCADAGLSASICYPVAGSSACTSPSCAPGATCDADSDCPGGMCVLPSEGFPGGYCTYSCGTDADCGAGAACRPLSNDCYATCASAGDCRAGYDCLALGATTTVCYPEGGTGTSPIGGACGSHDDCQGGRCWSESDTGLPGGFCYDVCGASSDCPTGALCGPASYCYQSCQWREDCRAGYTCYPMPEQAAQGFCWWACQDDSDCEGGDSCNAYGLCGDSTPPRTDPRPTATVSPRRPKRASGCTALGSDVLTCLAALALLWRRRRGGGGVSPTG